MNAQEMIRQRRSEWLALEHMLGKVGRTKRRSLPAPDLARFAAMFRSVCADLARARAQGFPDDLVDYLNALAARSHNAFYVSPPRRAGTIAKFFATTLPLTLRRNMRYLAAGVALFFVPFLGMMQLGYRQHPVVYKIVPKRTLERMERMYSKGHKKGRSEAVDTAMTGYYVYNNVGIAFRCFAAGIFLGIGSLIVLLFNGVLLGTVIGFVAQTPSGPNIVAFVVGHGPFELFAIALSGAAGIRLGLGALVAGNRRRRDALREAGKEAVQMIAASALLLFGAALTEGFFSPSSLPVAVKVGFGALCVALIIFYFGVYPFFVERREARRAAVAAAAAEAGVAPASAG